MDKFMRTTGNSFDGYCVDEYIDVISDEVIFRNSLFKQISASVRDFIGSLNIMDTEVKGSSALIANGKKYVLDRVTQKAKEMGGNAILGLKFESTFGEEIIRIAISGTVVHIMPDASRIKVLRKSLTVQRSNRSPFRIHAILCQMIGEKSSLALDLYAPQKRTITGIKCDIVLYTSFNDVVIVKNLTFTGLNENAERHSISDPVEYNISDDLFKVLEYADVMVKKCIIDGAVMEIAHSDIVTKEDLNVFENERQSEIDFPNLLDTLEEMHNAKEIRDYLSALVAKDPGLIPEELIERIDSLVEYERYYGNAKVSCISACKKFLMVHRICLYTKARIFSGFSVADKPLNCTVKKAP